MGITDRIKKLGNYFKEMQIVTIDGKQVIYVIVKFPYGWVIDEEIEEKYNVTVSAGEYNDEFYFCTEMDNGEENVFEAIEYNIEKMKEAIERAQLLSEKTKELKRLFENESITLTQLRGLKITYNENDNIIVPKKNKGKEENKSEVKASANE
jgi:hypothetical protein